MEDQVKVFLAASNQPSGSLHYSIQHDYPLLPSVPTFAFFFPTVPELFSNQIS